MKTHGIEDVIHLENDVMIYYNCDDFFNNKIDNTKIYIPFDSFDRNIASIIYIPNHNVFHCALENYDFNKNDMQNFAVIKKKTNIIENFPIFISDASQNEEYHFVTQNFDSFQMIFDAAAMGQYLGGIDPRNQDGDTRGFINETCVIKYNNYSFYYRVINGIARPFIMVQDALYPIFNLHIHSKNLQVFKSEELPNSLQLYNKKCIATLTRGYDNTLSYYMLIRRNEYIRDRLKDKNLEIIIFHEGNIKHEHQNYIRRHTPELNIIFIDVNNGKAFRKEKESIRPNYETNMFGVGYRHMCSFWFVDFWNFLENYDSVIRIDEDCYIEFDPDALFDDISKIAIITGKIEQDHDFVTRGMNSFTLNFVREHINPKYDFNFQIPTGPYTNVFALNLNKLRNNVILHKYIENADRSDQIYVNRWGDLPLWGQVITHILGPESLKVTPLRYYHESHNVVIN
jgi:hypothetical protein